MKKVFFGLSLLLFVYSCNYVDNNRIPNKAEKESQILISKQNARINLLEKVRIDSLEKIAWGDLKFGMSLDEAKKTKTFKDAMRSYKDKDSFKQFLLAGNDNRIIGFKPVYASFFNEKLYQIDFDSHWETANYYDSDIREKVYNLKKLIEKKYGKPTRDYGFPSFLAMRPRQSIQAFGWVIGNKHIYIGVSEAYGGSEYKVKCNIINNKEIEPVREFRRKRREEESKQTNGF